MFKEKVFKYRPMLLILAPLVLGFVLSVTGVIQSSHWTLNSIAAIPTFVCLRITTKLAQPIKVCVEE